MLILAIALSSATAVAAASPSPAPSPRPLPRASAAPPRTTGTVRGPDGQAVVGALVIVSQERLDIAVAPASTKTDASGQFRVNLRSASPFTLRVEAPGLAARTLRHQVPGPAIAVVLARGTTIEGFVRETATGTPAPGATVEAREERRGAPGLAWDPDSGVVRATTDAKGAYRLDGLASGLYTLTAFARGLGRAERRGVPAGRPADLLLTTGGAVSGTVTDASGKPVGAAMVRLTTALPMARDLTLLARTDGRGSFAIHGIPTGEYRVVGRHPDFAPAISPPVTVERDGEARADLVLSRPATVRGRLLGPDEKPTRGQAIVKELADVDAPDVLAEDLTAEAGDDGVFTLRLGPGSHSLEVRARGLGSRRLDVDVRGSGETVDLGDVALEVGIAIRGRVRDAAGRPLENAEVSTFYDSQSFSERTDAAGAYVLAGLNAGMYTVGVSAPGMGRAQRKAEAGASGVDFVLQPAGRIAGRVVDEAGRPVDAFRVVARMRARSGYGPMPRDNFAGDDGRFALEDVGEGEYVVDVTAPERAPAVVSDVKVAAGATVDVGTVRLAAGGIVRGLVVDAASAPVAGAWASITGAVRDFSRSAPEVTTDAGGAFEFRGVPPGAAQVTVTHPSYAPGTASGLDVDPARGAVETRVVLTQGGRIDGHVRSRSGALPPGAAVYVNPKSGGGWGSGPPMQSIAPDGTFVVEHVPVGHASVMLMSGRQGDYRTVAQVDAEVREAETTSVELSLRNIAVGGKVTRGGAPLAGARIEMESARGTMWFGGGGGPDELPPNVGLTAEDGTYHLTLGEPGEVYVDIQTPDRKSHLTTANLQVPDAESYVADFTFSGTFVEGVVVDRETEQPVAGAFVTAQRKDPRRGGGNAGSYGESDAEGRFHLELDAGAYLVTARMEGYGGDGVPVSLGESNVTGVRVLVARGVSLKGRLVDAAGRGVGGVNIRGTTMEVANRFNVGGRTLPDGSFELSGVRTGRYALAAAAGGSFAIVAGVTPGGRPTTLALSPGGRVRVKVMRTDGAPAMGSYARPSGPAGIRVFLPGGEVDPSGMVEFAAPAGQIEVSASSPDGNLEARALVTVEVGATASLELTLKPPE